MDAGTGDTGAAMDAWHARVWYASRGSGEPPYVYRCTQLLSAVIASTQDRMGSEGSKLDDTPQRDEMKVVSSMGTFGFQDHLQAEETRLRDRLVAIISEGTRLGQGGWQAQLTRTQGYQAVMLEVLGREYTPKVAQQQRAEFYRFMNEYVSGQMRHYRSVHPVIPRGEHPSEAADDYQRQAIGTFLAQRPELRASCVRVWRERFPRNPLLKTRPMDL